MISSFLFGERQCRRECGRLADGTIAFGWLNQAFPLRELSLPGARDGEKICMAGDKKESSRNAITKPPTAFASWSYLRMPSF
jgi:hypothetical protein